MAGCRNIVSASGCHQNCLEAMSCVKTIEVIFEESRCRKIYFYFLFCCRYFVVCYAVIKHVQNCYISISVIIVIITWEYRLYKVDLDYQAFDKKNMDILSLQTQSNLAFNILCHHYFYCIILSRHIVIWSRTFFKNLLPYDAYVILLTNTQLFPQEGKSVSDDKIVGKIVKK